VRREQAAGTGRAGGRFDLKLEGHCSDCSNRPLPALSLRDPEDPAVFLGRGRGRGTRADDARCLGFGWLPETTGPGGARNAGFIPGLRNIPGLREDRAAEFYFPTTTGSSSTDGCSAS
jgi:hypothetical protein